MMAAVSKHLAGDKPFYHHPGTVQPFGFVLLSIDASGFADFAAHSLKRTSAHNDQTLRNANFGASFKDNQVFLPLRT
jgi:hypothetical protein